MGQLHTVVRRGPRISRTDYSSDLRLCLDGEAEEGFVVFPVSQFTVF